MLRRYGQKAPASSTVKFIQKYQTPDTMAYVTFGYNYTMMDGQMLLFRLQHNAMVRDYNMVGSWGTIGSPSRAPSVQLPNGDAMVSMSHYQAG